MNTVKQHHRLSLFLGSLFLTCILLTGCFGKGQSDEQVQAAFDTFLNDIFLTEVKEDGITFNFTLSHPESYGITEAPQTLGDYSLDYMEADMAKTENLLSALKDFPYRKLTDTQKLTYDVLKASLEQNLKGSDFLLYQRAFSKTIGLQAQLPVLFAEYHFSDKASVDTYLTLLSDVERYYQQILDFEEAKIQAGLFMSHATAADIIEQCQDFISKTDTNFLIEVFNDRLDTIGGLSTEEKDTYRQQNKEIVLHSVIPAYKNIISFLTQHIDDGINNGGLCYLPEGKEYYQHLITSSTGSSKTIKEVDEALDSLLRDTMGTMQEIIAEHPEILEAAMDVSYPMKEPAKILSYLEEAVKADYPGIEKVDYSIKYVHESLQPSISPAFYLIPPIDDDNQNSIYINPYKDYNLDTIFTTLAHEGYPGHLYQNVYFSQTNPAPIRSLLSCTGYSEGWATYVEMDSYYLSGIDKTLAEFLRANNLATLCMYGKVDVGVNYYGWDLSKATDYLGQFGVTDAGVSRDIYQSMIAEPGNYLNYILGCIEFLEMKDTAMKKLGDSFVLKDFHEFILSSGPARFEVLNDYLKDWMKNYKA